MKIPGSPTKPANFQCSSWLAWFQIQLFDPAALLDFPNVIGQNGSNYDIKKRFCGGCDAQKNLATVSLALPSQWVYCCLFFRLIRDVKRDISDVQRNASDKNHRRADLPAGSKNGFTNIFK